MVTGRAEDLEIIARLGDMYVSGNSTCVSRYSEWHVFKYIQLYNTVKEMEFRCKIVGDLRYGNWSLLPIEINSLQL